MTQRRLIIALIVSVACNFALAGVLLGNHWYRQANVLSGAPLQRLVEALPQEARPAVRQALQSRRVELTRALGETRRARQRVRELATRQPVATTELEQAFADLRAATEHLQALLHQALLDGLREESR